MATYKVPQNVEADDKLIGPLSLKQFIFVILGLGSGYLTFFFATRIHPLACIPFVPFTAAFLILGLYQRSDQPVEIYLASAIRFRLKPHTRKWDQEGYEERVIITAPPKIEKHYTKGYSPDQVTSHLGSLSRLMDTRGWASKVASDWQNPDLQDTANSDRLVNPGEIALAQTPPSAYVQPIDVQDETSSLVARGFEAKIQQAESETHQKAILALERARQSSASEPEAPLDLPTPTYTRYPTMHQKTIKPVAEEPAEPVPEVPVAAATENTLEEEPAALDQTDSTESTDAPRVRPEPRANDNEVEVSLH